MISLNEFHFCHRCGLHKFNRRGTPVYGRYGTVSYHASRIVSEKRQRLNVHNSIPVDIIFIGEAPGKVEDTQGMPFIGRSGQLLDAMIAAALEMSGKKKVAYFITNIVACRPCNSLQGENRIPSKQEIARCSPRLLREMEMFTSDNIIFLGETAHRIGRKIIKNGIRYLHPAFILRKGGASSAVYLQFVRDLSEVIKNAATD